jgi:hypothetical protein
MSNLIPISLAEAALDAQAKQYVSKATFDEVWMLYQQALEEIQMLKQDAMKAGFDAIDREHKMCCDTAFNADQLKVTQSAALSLANLADNAFYYSREHRAAADILIKTIRTICPDHNG